MMGLHVPSTLSPDLERLSHGVIGCCTAVHRELGPGLSERTYARACSIELQHQHVKFEVEKVVPIRYQGNFWCNERIDLFVDRKLVLELKSVDRIHPVHIAQVVSYLRATHVRLGLIVNFNVPILKQGIRRVIL